MIGRVLILTGRLCGGEIRDSTRNMRADVMELPVDVASLMTPKLIKSHLKGRDLSRYSYILLPGMIRADLGKLEEEFGIPFFLGPVHHTDIPITLQNLDENQLSRTSSADIVLEEILRSRVDEIFQKSITIPADTPPSTIILGSGKGRVAVGRDFPPRVVAEIVDAPLKNVYDILLEAKGFVGSGASIVDVGMIPGEDNPDFIKMIVPLIKRDLGVPVSVDSMRVAEILAAADAKADMILSICGSTLDLASSIEPACVLVPMMEPGGERPKSTKDKVELLLKYDRVIQRDDIILDPLLEPIGLGFSNSLEAYMSLQRAIPDRPALMGVGNVTELADADSIGMNALLAAFASETRTSLLLTTENSPKTMGSVKELSTACKMMYYSCQMRIPPKNIGINLLHHKEKVHLEYPLDMPKIRVQAPTTRETTMDIMHDPGKFHIAVRRGQIHAIYRSDELEIDIIGRSAEDIANEMNRRGILPESRHAFYLGGELTKAEIALKMARSYIQDQPLFKEEGEVDKGHNDRDGS